MLAQRRLMQTAFMMPGPPFFGRSLQGPHSPHSAAVHAAQTPQRTRRAVKGPAAGRRSGTGRLRSSATSGRLISASTPTHLIAALTSRSATPNSREPSS